MINIFKNLRRGFIQKGKFWNYLTYAFGEIFLVIVGILLALQINNYNQKKSNERRFHLILENLQREIELDISTCDYSIKEHAKRDSTIAANYFLDASLDSIKKIKGADFYPHLSYSGFKANKSIFGTLLQNQEIVPSKNIDLIFSLSAQYVNWYDYIMEVQGILKTQAYEKRKEYLDLFEIISDDVWLSFVANNPRYKSDLYNYKTLDDNFIKMVRGYRSRGIENYLKIDSILQTNSPKNFLLALEDEPFLGTYIFKEDSTSIELIRKENQLLFKENSSFYNGYDKSIALAKINDSTLFFNDELNVHFIIKLKKEDKTWSMVLPKSRERYKLEKLIDTTEVDNFSK
ncbi:DUF6090 family protein [Belliella kenyensis]|uniref:DUF6090 family protein n=1 Tax=Belliella kenyensis TaxID=1472724 RepID=A0ABV8EL61_9BACT|nr:DUF6090 family protein [Belliella kenyensis]MCH7403297.1 DUF6090 family protein [Belliella kenyensis]MDN3602938.1 DUF6090 family protein [Belliella kenyensis]